MKNKHFITIFIVFLFAFIVKMFVGSLGFPEALLGCFLVGLLAFFKYHEKVLSDEELANFKKVEQEELQKKVTQLENNIGKLQMEKATAVRRF